MAISAQAVRISSPAQSSLAVSDTAPPQWTDAELLARTLRREEIAWTELLRRYRTLVYRCITKVTRKYAPSLPNAEIDEVYAEVLLSLLRDDLRKLRKYDPERGAKLSSWIGMITINITHDYLRRMGRRPALDRIDGAPESREESERTPLDELLEKERWAQFNGLLSDFSEKDRTFLNLYYGQGMEAERVADEMAISVKTVYSKKHKIRRSLRQRIESAGDCSAIADLAA
ncbi:RNA polymerase sigma factor [Haliangium ochraceum]|uniref:RNA polymerase, sigma-24 subunit, ECF subfamily n=1 Tax=Haliangium ochraceum (strain DSM 14365 / JCM 11303 / SMP-2) TaxID=502025 RepID=D0LHS1_HALO1|nr:sigma-70 family RNA polymerase sigma factor [Haliangium ochraceum]ACY12933.1 RNA polymerase, sigma-24 subunit, ECF subfamily [Haliangium ochraceum DSM 14365]